MCFLRFDIKSTRSLRLATDQFALASNPWNSFMDNCALCYKPTGDNIAVVEQLFPTKMRSKWIKWTQYIASKPDKYGIKCWFADHVNSKYLINGFPCMGKDATRLAGQRLADSVVLKLITLYKWKRRNVTTDNFFTSLNLAKELALKATSIVGTVNKVRRELPPSAALDKTKELHSTSILKHENCTLTIYKCKPTKNVVLLSSMHHSVSSGTDVN